MNEQLITDAVNIAENLLSELNKANESVLFFQSKAYEFGEIARDCQAESERLLGIANKAIAAAGEAIELNKRLTAENQILNDRIERGFE